MLVKKICRTATIENVAIIRPIDKSSSIVS